MRLNKLDVHSDGDSVLAGNVQCGNRNVHCGNACRGALVSNGYRDAPVPSSKIEYFEPCRRRQYFERRIDQRFRICSRDQYVWGDTEIESIKFPPSDQIGDRFAGATATNQVAENSGGPHLRNVVAMRRKPGARHAQCMPKQDLRFALCFDMTGKVGYRFVEQCVDSQLHACTANVSSAINARSSV